MLGNLRIMYTSNMYIINIDGLQLMRIAEGNNINNNNKYRKLRNGHVENQMVNASYTHKKREEK